MYKALQDFGMNKSLANVLIESKKDGHIQVDKYWLLKDGQVTIDSIREHLPTSDHFTPEDINNSKTPVSSRLVGLNECPSEIQTIFSEVLARRERRKSKPDVVKVLPEPSQRATSVRLAQIMQFR